MIIYYIIKNKEIVGEIYDDKDLAKFLQLIFDDEEQECAYYKIIEIDSDNYDSDIDFDYQVSKLIEQ